VSSREELFSRFLCRSLSMQCRHATCETQGGRAASRPFGAKPCKVSRRPRQPHPQRLPAVEKTAGRSPIHTDSELYRLCPKLQDRLTVTRFRAGQSGAPSKIIKADFVAITGPSFEFGHTYSFAPVRYRLPSSSLYLFNYLSLFPLRSPLASVAHRNPDGGEASKSACCPRKRISSPGLRGDGQTKSVKSSSGGHASAKSSTPKGGEENLVSGCPRPLLSPRLSTFPSQTLRPGNSGIP